MIGQNVVNIPLTIAKDSPEQRQELTVRLTGHAATIVEAICDLPPAEQQAVLEMAKQLVIANNARLYDLTIKSAEGQAQQMMGQMFGMGGDTAIRPLSKHGASWLQEELGKEEPDADPKQA